MLTLVTIGIVASGLLLIWAIRLIIRFERQQKINARLEAAIEGGRIARDAEAHRLNLEAVWRG